MDALIRPAAAADAGTELLGFAADGATMVLAEFENNLERRMVR